MRGDLPRIVLSMHFFFPTIAVLIDILPGAVGVVGVMIISFVIITLIASHYRFKHIVQLAEDSQLEEMGTSAADILQVQLARFFVNSGRNESSFSIALIQMNDSGTEIRKGAPFVESVKRETRAGDITCVYNDRTVALLFEAEPEDSKPILVRIIATVAQACPSVITETLRVGIASYPSHGLIGNELLGVAQKALSQATGEVPIVFPEIMDEENDLRVVVAEAEPSEFEEEGSSNQKHQRKNAIVDELTGVLKPSAIARYMPRAMADLRQKKKNAALFCIGVNNIDQVERFHGKEVADDVLAGVSKILQADFRLDDLIGRHENDAFLVLVPASLDEARVIGKRISTIVQRSEIISGTKKIKTTITIGVAASPEHGRNLHLLYRAGQKALDHSRANDIRACAVYDPEIHDSTPAKQMKSIKSTRR